MQLKASTQTLHQAWVQLKASTQAKHPYTEKSDQRENFLHKDKIPLLCIVSQQWNHLQTYVYKLENGPHQRIPALYRRSLYYQCPWHYSVLKLPDTHAQHIFPSGYSFVVFRRRHKQSFHHWESIQYNQTLQFKTYWSMYNVLVFQKHWQILRSVGP